VAIPGKQNPGSEILKTEQGGKRRGKKRKVEVQNGDGLLHFELYFAFLLLLFGLGILVLVFWYYMKKQSVISRQHLVGG
jgi:hypothetical protein